MITYTGCRLVDRRGKVISPSPRISRRFWIIKKGAMQSIGWVEPHQPFPLYFHPSSDVRWHSNTSRSIVKTNRDRFKKLGCCVSLFLSTSRYCCKENSLSTSMWTRVWPLNPTYMTFHQQSDLGKKRLMTRMFTGFCIVKMEPSCYNSVSVNLQSHDNRKPLSSN